MLRLPPGLRERLQERANESGRSLNTEIVDAIEKHLAGASRIDEMWAWYQKHCRAAE
jgi:predicted DNA-binding protein